MSEYWLPLAGGGLIGLAATMLMLFNGRLAGISGITEGAMQLSHARRQWHTPLSGAPHRPHRRRRR